MQKTINILGATGSIGTSTLSVVKQHSELYKVGVVMACSNWQALAKIAIEYGAHTAAIADEGAYEHLKSALAGTNICVMGGEKAVIEAAEISCDITMAAISGFAGLSTVCAALKACKTLAVANKESLVCAGEFVLELAEKYGVKVIPVDSEHNALFQVFEQHNAKHIEKITITASGGALRDYSIQQMQSVTVEQALAHPNWRMGPKVTIDSATLANKGLEYIEACVLFPVSAKQVDVLVHPQSVIHGMVHYVDGSVLAHLALPDMTVPIAHTLAYPTRIPIRHQALDLAAYGHLTFSRPDYARFPMLKLAQESFQHGIAARICYNAANEIMVTKFLRRQIKFLDIYRMVAGYLQQQHNATIENLQDVFAYHNEICATLEDPEI
jgi:1-deoxy-D-xylulose-5-phosphate reductoisomerase